MSTPVLYLVPSAFDRSHVLIWRSENWAPGVIAASLPCRDFPSLCFQFPLADASTGTQAFICKPWGCMCPEIQHILGFGKVDSTFHVSWTSLSVVKQYPVIKHLPVSSGNMGLLPRNRMNNDCKQSHVCSLQVFPPNNFARTLWIKTFS